jgi:uracil-DNA glycosylase family 4
MTDDWEDDSCKSCGNTETVVPYGNKNSPILIVGEFPGEDEISKGIPFTGATGIVLRYELAKVGIDLNSVRRCNIWQHKSNKKKECFNAGVEVVIKEAANRKLVLLIGSATVKYFIGEKVSEVNGLEFASPYISATTIACVQPATIFQARGSIGEIRFALKNFANKIEEMKLL